MKLILFVSMLTLLTTLKTAALAGVVVPTYAVAVLPTPVLNTPDFEGTFASRDGKVIGEDGCGQFRALEFIALPGTRFKIKGVAKKGSATVYKVSTGDYPFPARKGYFVDARFVKTMAERPPERPRRLPPFEKIIENLLAAHNSPYVWGGNFRTGIPEMLSFFQPYGKHHSDVPTADRLQLRGVDCSGLLYEATDGFTPRNTSALVHFGRPVPVAGLSPRKIAGRLEPLDLVVWDGHVMIVIDPERIIESRLDCTGKSPGVGIRPLLAALEELGKGRRPMNDYRKVSGKGFVVRRWYTGTGRDLP